MSLLQNISNSCRKEYNILLLGATGTGKSTTINALANYMQYSTFEEAIKRPLVELIASKFVLAHPETDEPVIIQSGRDDNELGLFGSEVGKSSTRLPQTYKFQCGNSVIRLIDTPGIGDTCGIDQDNKNLDQILGLLNCFKDLHGILILLKSNENRQTPFFKYCIMELLTYLHKSSCDNIAFCFTFSRDNFYRAGNGFFTLKSFFEKELQLPIELSAKKNCYFIDNEAYRFLLAKKSGYSFPDDQAKLFKNSWDKSVEQSVKMFAHITTMEPHDLEKTTLLNSARKLIYEIAEPMVRLKETLDSNKSHLNDKENELQNLNRSKVNLKRNLEITVDYLEQINLQYPTTVCTAASCTETIVYRNEQRINYIQRCHENCKEIKSLKTNRIGHAALQNCWSMNYSGLNCTKCGCSWQVHMHITCMFRKVKRSIVDSNRQKEVNDVDCAISNTNYKIRELKNIIHELEQEMLVVEEIGSKFGSILIEHSIAPYNKFYLPYLNLLINEEKKNIGAVKSYHSQAKLNSLEMMKATHLKKVDILNRAIKNRSKSTIEIVDIFNYRDQLCRLKHTGAQFAQMLNNTEFMNKNNFKFVEKTGGTVTSTAFCDSDDRSRNGGASAREQSSTFQSNIKGNITRQERSDKTQLYNNSNVSQILTIVVLILCIAGMHLFNKWSTG